MNTPTGAMAKADHQQSKGRLPGLIGWRPSHPPLKR